MIKSPSILFRMRNVSDEICREKSEHILCSISFLKNVDAYEIMWKNTVHPDKPQVTVLYGTCTLHAG